MRGLKYIMLFLLCLNSIVLADSVTLDGQAEVDDAYLDGNNTTTSYATETWVYVNRPTSPIWTLRALLKFDLTGITGTIDSVSLYFQRHLPASQFQVLFYRVTSDWEEVLVADPVVTWTLASTGVNWTTAGGDYNSTVIDSLTNLGAASGNSDVYCQRGEGVGLAQLVQDWVDGTYSNYGIIIKPRSAGADTLYFWSSENFDEESYPRPKLYVEYTPDAGGLPDYRHSNTDVGVRHNNTDVGVRHKQ